MAESLENTIELDAPTNGAVAVVPESVTLYAEDLSAPRFTPRELNEVRASLGRSFSQVLVDETTDDKFSVLAWLKLRRQGVTVPWDAMADVVIEIRAEERSGLDPTKDARPRTSPPSATTGE